MRCDERFLGLVLCLYLAPTLCAQDAVKVDPKHYTVVTENDQVRVFEAALRPTRKIGNAQSSRHGCGVPYRCQGQSRSGTVKRKI